MPEKPYIINNKNVNNVLILRVLSIFQQTLIIPSGNFTESICVPFRRIFCLSKPFSQYLCLFANRYYNFNRMKFTYISIFLLFSLVSQSQTDSLLLPTPPMGWISWNLFEGNINERIVKEIADAFVENGLKDAGYEYIIIDDLWQGGRDENGKIFPDSTKFPGGMKALAAYVHGKGLKFGIYTDIANYTCGGKTGSYGYEASDARTFADWGVDYIKCDYCNAPPEKDSAVQRYSTFIDAVRATGRPVAFAVCEWGQREPWLWSTGIGGNVWRTTWDLRDTWTHGQYDSGHNGIMETLDRQAGLERYAGPGHWNDPDMLLTGLYGKGASASANGAGGCTVTEYESQFGLWALLAAPLLITCDVRNMDKETKRILTNKEIIAVNQDKAGKQASRILKQNDKEIWAKPLAGGGWAAGFLNRNDDKTLEITLPLDLIRMPDTVAARDLWKHKDLGKFKNNITLKVEPHQCRVVKILMSK